MIGQRELEQRATRLGISVQHAELDYVLNHVLAQIARDPEDLVFRSGTALSRVYWPDFRISEDLDFACPSTAPFLERQQRRAVDEASGSTGLELSLRSGGVRDDRSRSLVDWTTPWNTSGQLLIDVVTMESATLPVDSRPLDLPYSDLQREERKIPVAAVAEILASKWLMLDDRNEPRDLFDLWWGLTQRNEPFKGLAAAHRLKFGFVPRHATIERARRLRATWDQRLGYQMARLPDFDEARVSVEQSFTGWYRQSVDHTWDVSPKSVSQSSTAARTRPPR